MNAKQIWQTTLERLHTKTQVAIFTTWFQGTNALSFQDGVLVVGVATTFAKAHLENRYTDLIRSILAEITGSAVDVRFVVSHELPEGDEDVADLLPPPPSPLPRKNAAIVFPEAAWGHCATMECVQQARRHHLLIRLRPH